MYVPVVFKATTFIRFSDMAAEDNRAEETYRAFQTRIRTTATTAPKTAATTVTTIPEIKYMYNQT